MFSRTLALANLKMNDRMHLKKMDELLGSVIDDISILSGSEWLKRKRSPSEEYYSITIIFPLCSTCMSR